MTELLDYITKWTAVHQSGDFRAESITIHWWGKPSSHRSRTTFDGVCRFLSSDNGNNSSAHFVVSGPERKLACLVDLDHAAWHAGNWTGNHRSIGIECWPFDDETPRSQVEQQMQAVAYVVALMWHWRPNLKDVPLKGHRDWYATACPGTYYPRLDDIERRARNLYPAVDPDRPGFLAGITSDDVTGELDMDKSDLQAAVWTADVVPAPSFNPPEKTEDNPTWRIDNVMRILLELTYETRSHARAAEALAQKAAEKAGVSPDEIRQAVSDALGELKADVTLTVD